MYAGMDHKLHIVLNKADQFRKIHDFARAYGSLCWNLSKVIQRKDLPRIHTMCLPPAYQSRASGDQSAEAESLGQGLIDLESTREEVVREVLNAPKRRVDNEITRLADSIALLQMHCLVVDEAVRQYRGRLVQSRIAVALSVATAASAVGAGAFMALPPAALGQAAVVGALASAGVFLYFQRLLADTAKNAVSPLELDKSFGLLFARELLDKDEYSLSMWTRVAEHIKLGVGAEDVARLERLRAADRATLKRIADAELPVLRRGAAPAMYSMHS